MNFSWFMPVMSCMMNRMEAQAAPRHCNSSSLVESDLFAFFI